jgi:hypothetical protein
MRPHSVGCVPTYSVGRQSIAVRPAPVTVIRRFVILTGCSLIKPSFRRRWWPGIRCAPWMMRLQMLQQLGVGHERLRFASGRLYFVSL